jgi:DNA gyrase/topoisomerase IV subunit A
MVKAKSYLHLSLVLVRFEETKTRPMGRTASGVRGITLKDE